MDADNIASGGDAAKSSPPPLPPPFEEDNGSTTRTQQRRRHREDGVSGNSVDKEEEEEEELETSMDVPDHPHQSPDAPQQQQEQEEANMITKKKRKNTIAISTKNSCSSGAEGIHANIDSTSSSSNSDNIPRLNVATDTTITTTTASTTTSQATTKETIVTSTSSVVETTTTAEESDNNRTATAKTIAELQSQFHTGLDTQENCLSFLRDLISAIVSANNTGNDDKMRNDLCQLHGFSAQNMNQLVLFRETLYLNSSELAEAIIQDPSAFSEIVMAIYKMIQDMDKGVAMVHIPSCNVSRTFGIQNLDLVSQQNLDRLLNRITELFEWYSDDATRNKFTAPYFSLVQSSGMGKTKLLYEASKHFNNKMPGYASVLVLFRENNGADDTQDENNVVFPTENRIQVTLTNSSTAEKTNQSRDVLLQKLNDLLHKCEGASKVVFLFDEVQHLLHVKNHFVFRAIRWWLKHRHHPKQVVAVFTSKSMEMAHIESEPSLGTSSRVINPYYETGDALYPPFFDICTIGCYVDRLADDDTPQTTTTSTEYARAIRHGRPLFALMQHHGKLDNNDDAHIYILDKMLLSERCKPWHKSNESCFSILATRVQMGQTSVALTSKLVEYGYAGLTHFKNDAKIDSTMCFFPDPVCARLAMCMMDEHWSLHPFQGKDKCFWVEQMKDMFCNGLCHPRNEDVGEIFVALYMLFCGDTVRKQYKNNYRTFSVPLDLWVQALLCNNKTNGKATPCGNRSGEPDEHSEAELNNGGVPRISFIQVCKNYSCSNLEDLLQQRILQNMYNGGTAYYINRKFHCFDVVGSIYLGEQHSQSKTYVPLLVSVVAHSKAFDIRRVKKQLQDMVWELEFANHNSGLCLLVYIGCCNSKAVSDADIDLKQNLSNLTNGIVSKVLFLEEDTFGISDMFRQVPLARNETEELHASHPLLYSYARINAWNEDALRPHQGADSEPSQFMCAFNEGLAEGKAPVQDHCDKSCPNADVNT